MIELLLEILQSWETSKLYSSEKKDFYKNKLLWKLDRNKLDSSENLIFERQRESIKKYLLQYTAKDTPPVIVFWNNKELWTFINGLEVVSMHSGMVHRIYLDEIKKRIKVPPLVQQGDVSKMTFHFIDLGNEEVRVWAPEGKTIFALMNILQMFPLLDDKR